MNNFKEEAVGAIALISGVITFLIFAASGNPNALGENLFWAIGTLAFSSGAITLGGAAYIALTMFEKISPKGYNHMIGTLAGKFGKFVENLVKEED